MTPTKSRFGATSFAVSLVGLLLLGACEVTVRVGGKKGSGGSDGSGGGDGGDGGWPVNDGGLSDGGVVIDAPWAVDGPIGTTPDGPPPPHGGVTSSSKLDLLFVIDDSVSMAPLQAKMRTRMPDFMNVMKSLPGGLPDLHIAVASSSLGAGVYGNVTGCTPGSTGNLDGNFQHKAGCGLNTGETYLKYQWDAALGGEQNFDPSRDITDVLSCVADLGQFGCGFEHQLESMRLALQKSAVPGTENYGFLRPNAMLAAVFLTNEDDCSVPADSMLFDPNQQMLSDALGGLQSYRCNEFGHRCDQPVPHQPPGTPVTMTGCHSAEDGKLTRISEYVSFLYSLKPGAPQNIFIALIAGPTEPYVVKSQTFMLGNGETETQPTVGHACTSGSGGTEYADPPVRLNELAQAFAPNRIVTSICADDYKAPMENIATAMLKAP